ncbi:hypothetical protein Tco_0782031, partial [Tanacetum coccineum]
DIFQLPQATDNNHKRFVAAPKFSEMVPFYINNLGFTLELRSPSNFKTTGLVQPWQTLCKMFSSHDELEAKQNVKKVDEHLIAEEIEKLVEGTDNVGAYEVDSSTLMQNDNQNDPDTGVEPKSNKESPEVEITVEVQPVNVNEEEEESAEDDYELKRREKWKNVEESRHTPYPTTIKSPRIHSTLISLDTKKLQELTVTNPKPSSSTPSSSSPKLKLSASQHILSLFKPKTGRFKRYKSFFDEIQGRNGYLFEHLKIRFMPRKKFHVLAQHLQEVMEESLPEMVDVRSQADVANMIVDAIQQERENLRVEISSQINNAMTNHIPSQVDSSIRNYMSSHILHVHPTQATLKIKFKGLQASNTSYRPSAIRPRDQDDPYDDAHPEGENSAKRQKTSEHVTYVFGESSSGQVNEGEPVIFLDDDIKERTSRWVDKCVKKFNPYARYSVEHWKNLHAKIFYIKKQKELRKPKEVVYSNSKIVQIIKTYWELGHEHKFITGIIARRANGSIVSITESDYKNLSKNDIEDLYLLIVNGKVDDYAETGLLWSLSVFIRSAVI